VWDGGQDSRKYTNALRRLCILSDLASPGRVSEVWGTPPNPQRRKSIPMGYKEQSKMEELQ